MTKEINCEPFLHEELIVFQNVFTLMDPAYNTSEIRPIMLSIPKSIKNKLRTTQNTLPQNVESKAIASITQKSKILTSANNINVNNQPPPQDTPVSRNLPAEKLQTVQHESHITLDPIIEKFIETDTLYWMLPIPSKRTASYHMLLERSKSAIQFKLFFDINKPFLMRAVLDGASVVDNLTVFIKNSQSQMIASLYDSTSDTYFATLSENNKKPTEICAAKFTKKNVFDLYIPALKKNKETGKSYMFPIPFGGPKSELYAKFLDNGHESIKIQSRANDSENVDLTYCGRFVTTEPSNFILYHKSSPNKDIISYGQTDDTGYYLLNISYPLNTVQGFFAAIASHLSY